MNEEVGTQTSIARLLEQSREVDPDGQKDQVHSSDEEGWGENDVAPGQVLSDYRPLNQPLVATKAAQGISEAGYIGPIQNSLAKAKSKDVPVLVGEQLYWCGLQNLGNSCYMNAGLQCLCSVPRFADFFLGNSNDPIIKPHKAPHDSPEEGKDTVSEGKLSSQAQLSSSFAVLLRKFWCGQFSSLHPKAFKMCLGLVHPPFIGSRQQDCQEFLVVVLDHLHEYLVGSQNPQSDSIVSRTFQGQLKNEVQCLHCGNVSTKVEPFVYLSLPLPGAHQRQIEVYWVPAIRDRHGLQVTRMFVTVQKQDSILELKSAICVVVSQAVDKDLLVMAEIKQGSITRQLGDSLALKLLTFSKGEKLYCFEMLPLSELTSSLHNPDPWSAVTKPTDPPHPAVPCGHSLTPSGDLAMQHDSAQTLECDVFGSQPFVHGNENEAETSANRATNTFTDIPRTTATVAGDETATMVPGSPSSALDAAAVVMEWNTCSICLEEMLDSDLVVHRECGGVVCSSCLQSSVQHFSQDNKRMPCPICSVSVFLSEAFCPLSSRSQPHSSNPQQLISFLQVVLLLRDSGGKLFGHPLISHLPLEAHGSLYYKAVSSLLPEQLAHLHWSLCFTEAKARFCSRCSFESFCSGCPLQRSTGSKVKLKPGDHITVTFADPLTVQQLHMVTAVETHSSYLQGQADSNLSLTQCLQAFSKSEELAEDSPWFCPICDCQQRAMRSLKVDDIPPVLIVHLKRFMFHSNSTKLDIPVEFPLDLNAEEVCPNLPVGVKTLSLVAVVCHFGTLQGGHYTAFVRKPSDGSWVYCNDSQVSQLSPSSEDAKSAYILFYQREPLWGGFDCTVLKAKNFEFDDDEEMKIVEQLMLSGNNVKAAMSTLCSQGGLKRTNSDPDIGRSQPPGQPHKKQFSMSPF